MPKCHKCGQDTDEQCGDCNRYTCSKCLKEGLCEECIENLQSQLDGELHEITFMFETELKVGGCD